MWRKFSVNGTIVNLRSEWDTASKGKDNPTYFALGHTLGLKMNPQTEEETPDFGSSDAHTGITLGQWSREHGLGLDNSVPGNSFSGQINPTDFKTAIRVV